MSLDSEPPAAATGHGDYHGRPSLRLASRGIWLDVLATGGPRLVRLGLADSSTNLLAETPDLGWETPLGRYELLGGHRLWFAPEDRAAVAVPDGEGLVIESVAGGVRLIGRPEPSTGLIRSFEIHLDQASPSFTICHELRNRGGDAIELAPWSITQLPLGGRVLVPQSRATSGHRVRPNRNLVLWPYTSWDDDRIVIRDGLVVVRATPGDDLKLGCLSDLGWIAYERDGVGLVRRFEPAVADRYPDLECNVEIYCGPRYLELEVLGPLRVVPPGGSTSLLERWEVRSLPGLRREAAELVRELEPALAPPLPRTA